MLPGEPACGRRRRRLKDDVATSPLRFDGGRQLRGEFDEAKYPVGAVHVPNKAPKFDLADQTRHVLQDEVPMPGITALR
jgi:hypothetical protein